MNGLDRGLASAAVLVVAGTAGAPPRNLMFDRWLGFSPRRGVTEVSEKGTGPGVVDC